MKFEKSKILALAVSMALVVTGCSKDENSSAQSESSTEKDLPTSSGFIDVSSDVYDSSLNSYDTSKPIDVVDSSSNSSTSSDDTSLTDDKSSENPTGDKSDSSSNSEGSTSSDASTSSSDANTSKPSSSSDTSSDDNSSSSDAGVFDLSETKVTKEQYFDKNGNPLPEDYDLSKGGYYNSRGDYTMTAEEYAEHIAERNRAYEAIKNGTYGTPDKETADALWALLGI